MQSCLTETNKQLGMEINLLWKMKQQIYQYVPYSENTVQSLTCILNVIRNIQHHVKAPQILLICSESKSNLQKKTLKQLCHYMYHIFQQLFTSIFFNISINHTFKLNMLQSFSKHLHLSGHSKIILTILNHKTNYLWSVWV